VAALPGYRTRCPFYLPSLDVCYVCLLSSGVVRKPTKGSLRDLTAWSWIRLRCLGSRGACTYIETTRHVSFAYPNMALRKIRTVFEQRF
jgi:hypothetical protein